MSELLNLMDMIKTFQEAGNNQTEMTKEDKEQQKSKKELEQLKLMAQQKEMEMQDLTSNNTTDAVGPAPTHTALLYTSNQPWRKDLKIAVQVGELGQKDRLTFSSLARQIENSISKGYTEPEIVDAVIRAGGATVDPCENAWPLASLACSCAPSV